MASIHKVKDCKNWMAAFYLPDGRRTMRSTGTSRRRDALKIAWKYEEAARLAREGRLTEARARNTIADLFYRANAERLPNATLAEYLDTWLKRKALELADTSFAAYERTADLLKAHLPAKAKRPMEVVTVTDAADFRDAIARKTSAVSANKNLKIARVIWNSAIRDGLVQDNVFARVERIKTKASKRRAFTLDELKRILAACNTEWRGMVLCGVYLGQRISDLVKLTWANVDLEAKEIHLVTGKTDRPMHIPLAAPLYTYLMTLPTSDDPAAPLFPRLAAAGSQTLSGQFRAIMASVGLAKAESHHLDKKKGRDARRDLSPLSFHSLRHTATSLLKNAGVSDVVARELIGHDSEAVSRVYTHIESKTLKNAIKKLPDITKED